MVALELLDDSSFSAQEIMMTEKGYDKYAENIFHLFLKTKLILFGLGISNNNINRFVLQECGKIVEVV